MAQETSNSKKRLFLIDGMALIYRAHFAFSRNPRINSKGFNTGAVYGFANSVFDILNNENPSHISVAFDTKAKTFRHEEYKEYKAHREKQPEDITLAIPYIMRLLKAMNIETFGIDGYEADDVIGTLAKKAQAEGLEAYMVTIDKDYAQLVDEKIFFYKLPYAGRKKSETWHIKEVCERWELDRPEQVIDILGLQGDTSDNIPGIPGIGEKTAIKLLKKYDTIENLLEHSDELKGKQKERVKENAEQALLSKHLATIKIDVPVDFDEEKLRKKDFNEDKLKSLFDELEFRRLKKKVFGEELKAQRSQPKKTMNQMDLFGGGTILRKEEKEKAKQLMKQPGGENKEKNIDNTPHQYHMIDSKELRGELVELLMKQDAFCFDTETTSLQALKAKLVGIAFCCRENEAYYVPVPQNDKEAQEIVEELRPVFEKSEALKIAQNLKYDMLVLHKYGIDLRGPFYDTMIAHYLIAPDARHGMDTLARHFLNYSPVPIEKLIGKKGKKQKSMASLKPEDVVDYACEDADITFQLWNKLEPELESREHVKLFKEVEIPLIPVLAAMEIEGVRINHNALEDYSEELKEAIEGIEKSIQEHAGEEFNIASPKQLGEILFDKMKLDPKAKRTSKSKQYATSEKVLSKLKDKHPIIEEILDFRELKKLKSTYVDALPELISENDGRIHTSYNQAVAATGRLSSTKPNLQNIPIRTEKGRRIRQAFVPPSDDYVLMAADYSQIELRIMADFSKDDSMLNAFREGRDIHAATAAKLNKVSLEEVTSDMRRKAKTANFGIIYGVSAHGLSEQLDISRKEAGEFIKTYFEEFEAVKQYMDDIINEARENEYVKTIMGRRRYLRDINSRNATTRGYAERNAINAPIQGSAADIIKVAMIRIHEWMKKEKLRSKMTMQVHDELVFDVHKDELETVKGKVRELMEGAAELSVPLKVDVGIGEDWLEAH